MTRKLLLLCIISLFISSFAFAQVDVLNKVISKSNTITTNNQAKKESRDTLPKVKDTLPKEHTFKIRFGGDLFKSVVLSEFIPKDSVNINYRGSEWVMDIAVYPKWYFAIEFGDEDKTQVSEQHHFRTKGTYTKIGVDWNSHQNAKGMDNMVYIGFRYGFSQHSQEVLSYQLFNRNSYWGVPLEVKDGLATGIRENLSTKWVEGVFGFKAELYNSNIYVGMGAQLKFLIDNPQPDNFANLYVPGFNKILDEIAFGVGINYTLSYSIPIYKTKFYPSNNKRVDPEQE